ncbi:MAG: site-2 protease family protein [Planctomycetes bacterium]|nr:site-2 protease family protein [Planctomycetota bacterium]
MRWSWKIAEVAGIGVFMHWTFLLLIAWILVSHIAQGSSAGVALEGVAFVLAIFACVILHEFGHALTARRYGIRTRDIVLLPIGGVARLERIPENPVQELWVALAGPAVNVVIAAVLFGLLQILRGLAAPEALWLVGGDFLSKLLYVNVVLVVFNLLPAFPMDGGRVLRALLAMRLDYGRATQIAATVGQAMAVAFGILGLFTNWFLLFIALFVFLGAQQEAHLAGMRGIARGVPVREAMITHFRALDAAEPLSVAVAELIAGEQQDFPVTGEGGRIVGVLTRADLLRALAEGRQDQPVASAMRAPCGHVRDTDMLDAVFLRMQTDSCSTMPVLDRGERLVGLITLENLGEWMMIHNALGKARSRSRVEDIYHPS